MSGGLEHSSGKDFCGIQGLIECYLKTAKAKSKANAYAKWVNYLINVLSLNLNNIT